MECKDDEKQICKFMKINNFFKLVIAVGVSLGAGVVGAIFTTPAVQSDWYLELIKPALNPPAWVFGPVWTILYVLMGIAAFLVWKRHPYPAVEPSVHYGAGKLPTSLKLRGTNENVRMSRGWRWAIGLFLIQLVLNTLWSVIFFGLHSPGGALIEIIFLWLAILATIAAFYKISKPAAWLLVPYILWVSFALYLNYSIWALQEISVSLSGNII